MLLGEVIFGGLGCGLYGMLTVSYTHLLSLTLTQK